MYTCMYMYTSRKYLGKVFYKKINADTNAYNLFWCFIIERFMILSRRMRNPSQPATKDRIISAHHFCNVFRDDDRETKDLMEYMGNNRLPFEDVALNICSMRFMLNVQKHIAICKTLPATSFYDTLSN